MNTRFVVTTKAWFGGGADLTPVLNKRRTQDDPDTLAFHAALKRACDDHAAIAPYDKYQEHGATSISGSSIATSRAASAASSMTGTIAATGTADFAFTQDVGRAFRDIYPQLVQAKYRNALRRA